MKCFNCFDWKCRCEDCCSLIEVNDLWFCDNYEKFCNQIEECAEWDEESGCDRGGLFEKFKSLEVGSKVYSDDEKRMISVENMCGGRYLCLELNEDFNGYEIVNLTDSLIYVTKFLG